MGRAEDQNLAARWRRSTLVSGGGKSTGTFDCLLSFSGAAVDDNSTCDEALGSDGAENALVLLVVKQASEKRCRIDFMVFV